MRITIGKGKLIALIILLVLLALFLVSIYLYYKGKISLPPSYANVYTKCEKTVEGGMDVYTCPAFLISQSENNSQECFVLSFANLDNILEGKTLCEKKGHIQWDKEVMNLENTMGSVIPVNIIFSERVILSTNGLGLRSIRIERLADEDTDTLIERIGDNYNLGGIRTHKQQGLIENGYSISYADIGIGYVYFKNVSLEEIKLEDSLLSVRFSVLFNGKETEFTSKTSRFSYIDDTSAETSSIKTIDTSNYGDFVLIENLDLTLVYLPSTSPLLGKDLTLVCAENEYHVCLYPFMMTSGFPTVEDAEKSLENAANSDGMLNAFTLLLLSKNE